jgi:REP-associated tyrosine transposase
MMHSAMAVRRSLRLPSFDYATAGGYFVTAVTHKRACVFGELTETDGAVHLNITGEMVRRWWNLIPQKFSSVTLDSFIVMPDHFHAIVLLNCSADPTDASVSLPRVMHWFKTMTTAEYFKRVSNDGWPRLQHRLWQRSYYDHIIRNDRDLNDIRAYIERNPGALLERRLARTFVHGDTGVKIRPIV